MSYSMHQARSNLTCDDLGFTGRAHVGAATPEIVVSEVMVYAWYKIIATGYSHNITTSTAKMLSKTTQGQFQ